MALTPHRIYIYDKDIHCDVYIYKRLDNSTIHFYKLEWEEEEEREVVGKLMFTLVKK